MTDRQHDVADRADMMAELQEKVDVIEERTKRVTEALDDAEEARKKAKKELDSLPGDLAELRKQLREISTSFPVADNLEAR